MPDSPNSLDDMQVQLGELNSQINQLQDLLQVQAVELDKLRERIPDSNIISPRFLNRAFAVWGHYVVAGFIIAVPFICLGSLFAAVMIVFSQPN